MTIFRIIALSILILIGISGIILGISLISEFQEGEDVFAITFSVALLFLSAILIVCTINDNTETTEKVIDKGTIITEVDFDYFNGGKDNFNEIKYFIEVESGDKIIIDKSEWDKIKDEYTYVPVEAECIKED